MSDNADEAVLKGILADLGRCRQDSLPLSDRELRGPSYAPVGKNGTGHFAARFKEGLKTKWSVKIRDEESEQVEGLVNEDARPWAQKIAKNFMAHNTAASAPPHVAQVARAQPVGRLGGLLPPGTSSVVVTSGGPKAAAVTGSRANVQKPVSSPPPSAITQAPKLPEQKVQPPRAAAQQTEPDKSPTDGEYVLSQGACDIRSASGAPDFKATFAIRFDLKANCGSLVLAANGKGQRVHNVLDLKPPVIEGSYCVIATRLGNDVYSLKLEDAALTEKFKTYLDNLQVSVGRDESPPATTTAADKGPASEMPHQPDRVQPQDASGTSNAASSAGSTLLAPPNGTPTEDDQADAKPPISQAPTLIDVTDTPPTQDGTLNARGMLPVTIEDAAERLYQLVQTIIPEITEQGLLLSEDAITEIDDVAIEHWLNRGFLETETEDIKAQLLALLRFLVHIRRKKLQRQTKAKVAAPLSSSMEELKGLEIGQTPKRIQYTASEIESLEGKATPRPKRLDSVSFFPKPASQKHEAKSTVEARMPQLSLCREWLTGSTNEEKTPSKMPLDALPQPNGSAALGTTHQAVPQTAVWDASQDGSADSYGDAMQIDSPGPAAAEPAKPPAPSKKIFRGLSSSRWAQ